MRGNESLGKREREGKRERGREVRRPRAHTFLFFLRSLEKEGERDEGIASPLSLFFTLTPVLYLSRIISIARKKKLVVVKREEERPRGPRREREHLKALEVSAAIDRPLSKKKEEIKSLCPRQGSGSSAATASTSGPRSTTSTGTWSWATCGEQKKEGWFL